MKKRTFKPGPKRKHRRLKRNDDKPVNWGQDLGGRKWRRAREYVFNRDNFLCQLCLDDGVYTAVALHGKGHGVCDHIIPRAEGGTDEGDNLQTICQTCDRRKTAAEANRGRARAKGMGA